MGHREDLLAGAVPALREKGYAHTTRPGHIVAGPRGTNLASIGYHYVFDQGAAHAAVLAAMDDFGAEMARAIGDPGTLGRAPWSRFERFWSRVNRLVPGQQPGLARYPRHLHRGAARPPRYAPRWAEGLEDGRKLWARSALTGWTTPDEETMRAIGSLHQALVSGVLCSWLI